MKNVININDKGLYHGYQERYWIDGKLITKCFCNNGVFLDYQEWYNHSVNYKLTKTFYI